MWLKEERRSVESSVARKIDHSDLSLIFYILKDIKQDIKQDKKTDNVFLKPMNKMKLEWSNKQPKMNSMKDGKIPFWIICLELMRFRKKENEWNEARSEPEDISQQKKRTRSTMKHRGAQGRIFFCTQFQAIFFFERFRNGADRDRFMNDPLPSTRHKTRGVNLAPPPTLPALAKLCSGAGELIKSKAGSAMNRIIRGGVTTAREGQKRRENRGRGQGGQDGGAYLDQCFQRVALDVVHLGREEQGGPGAQLPIAFVHQTAQDQLFEVDVGLRRGQQVARAALLFGHFPHLAFQTARPVRDENRETISKNEFSSLAGDRRRKSFRSTPPRSAWVV